LPDTKQTMVENDPVALTVSPLEITDREWVRNSITREWGDTLCVVHGETFFPDQLPGFKALSNGRVAGLVTYKITNLECEVITLNSFQPAYGNGAALLKAVEDAALVNGCQSCWLVTTNDNLNALGFYLKRWYVITQIHPNTVEDSRKIKPSIPLFGENGIPIQDEIYLRKNLLTEQK
jgi:ribosomal protein S18 acetylase RimI-like enzyme